MWPYRTLVPSVMTLGVTLTVFAAFQATCVATEVGVELPPSPKPPPQPPIELSTSEAELRYFIESSPGAYLSPSIELFTSSIPGAGISVRSSNDLLANEVLAVLPPELLVGDAAGSKTACTFTGSDEWREALSVDGDTWFPALCLFEIRYGTPPRVGEQARAEGIERTLDFGPWLDLLPAYVPNAAYYGDDTARQSGHRPFFERGYALMTDTNSFLRKVFGICSLAGHDSPNSCLGVATSLNVEDGLRWAISIVMSRGFGLANLRAAERGGESQEQQEIRTSPFLAPFDFFNHDITGRQRNVRYPVEAESEKLVFSTTRPIAAGEELLISYGSLSSINLAVQYGFVPTGGIPKNDVLEVAFGPDPEDPNADLKARIISESLGFSRGALRRDMHISAETMAALRISTLTPKEMSGHGVSEALRGHSISEKNDRDSIWLLRDVCVAYSTTLAEIPVPRGSTPPEEALRVVLQYREMLRAFVNDCVSKLNSSLGPG